MKNLRSIRVAELIDLLEGEDGEAMVVFSSDYGDRSHTEQVHSLEGLCERATIRESAYSSSGFAISEPDEDEPESDGLVVLVLR